MRRTIYLVLGFVSLALGFIGLFLPILPTAPFLIVAAMFFSRSSRRWRDWLLSQPRFGPMIREWEIYQVIRPKAKIFSFITIIVGISSSLVFFPFPFWAKVVTAVVVLGVLIFIGTRPSSVEEAKARHHGITRQSPSPSK